MGTTKAVLEYQLQYVHGTAGKSYSTGKGDDVWTHFRSPIPEDAGKYMYECTKMVTCILYGTPVLPVDSNGSTIVL